MSTDAIVLKLLDSILAIIAITVSLLAMLVSYFLSRRSLRQSREIAGTSLNQSRVIADETLSQSRDIAEEYGDLAGTEAAIAYQEEKAAVARRASLQALHAEVGRIRLAREFNAKLEISRTNSPVPMPVAVVESVLLSKEPILFMGHESYGDLVAHAVVYLGVAGHINAQIPLYLTLNANIGTYGPAEGIADEMLGRFSRQSEELLPVLDELDAALEAALSAELEARLADTKSLPVV